MVKIVTLGVSVSFLMEVVVPPLRPRPMVGVYPDSLQLASYWWYSIGSVWIPSGNTQRLS